MDTGAHTVCTPGEYLASTVRTGVYLNVLLKYTTYTAIACICNSNESNISQINLQVCSLSAVLVVVLSSKAPPFMPRF